MIGHKEETPLFIKFIIGSIIKVLKNIEKKLTLPKPVKGGVLWFCSWCCSQREVPNTKKN